MARTGEHNTRVYIRARSRRPRRKHVYVPKYNKVQWTKRMDTWWGKCQDENQESREIRTKAMCHDTKTHIDATDASWWRYMWEMLIYESYFSCLSVYTHIIHRCTKYLYISFLAVYLQDFVFFTVTYNVFWKFSKYDGVHMSPLYASASAIIYADAFWRVFYFLRVYIICYSDFRDVAHVINSKWYRVVRLIINYCQKKERESERRKFDNGIITFLYL